MVSFLLLWLARLVNILQLNVYAVAMQVTQNTAYPLHLVTKWVDMASFIFLITIISCSKFKLAFSSVLLRWLNAVHFH